MSQIQVDKLLDKSGEGAPQLTYGAEVPVGYGITGAGGVNISGYCTATEFAGRGTGISAINASNISSGTVSSARITDISGNAAGLTGTPDVTVNNITAGIATYSGNISAVNATFSGSLTYDDVTNVDSVGIVTARGGLRATAGGLVVTAGIATLTAVPEFSSGIEPFDVWMYS